MKYIDGRRRMRLVVVSAAIVAKTSNSGAARLVGPDVVDRVRPTSQPALAQLASSAQLITGQRDVASFHEALSFFIAKQMPPARYNASSCLSRCDHVWRRGANQGADVSI